MPDTTAPNGILDAFNPDALPAALAWIVGAIVLMRVAKFLLGRLARRAPRRRLRIKQVATLTPFVVYAAAIVLTFASLFELSSEALFALSGTIAVTVGFALKDVAASFIASITILFSKPFQVGDLVTFGGYYGEVREIGLRSVRIVTLDDNLVTVPSNKFLTEAVASANAGALDCMVVTSFHITPEADHGRAREIVEESVISSKYLYLGKPFVVLFSTRLTERGTVVVELTAKAYVFDTRHERAFASDVTDRVLRAFREAGIRMPTVCPGPTEPDGSA